MSESTTLTAPKPSAPEKKKTDKLNATHRCDRSMTCNAAAYVRVFFDYGGYIQFCGHHFQEIEVDLLPFINHEETIDERYKLTWDRTTGTENS